MQAATAAGVYIPHLCHHADFDPIGGCKVCSVQVSGRLMASCTLPASAGMVVESDARRVATDRKRLVQMLFVQRATTTAVCGKSGSCHLQALGYHLGMQDTHFMHEYPHHAVDASHPKSGWTAAAACCASCACGPAAKSMAERVRHRWGA